MVMSCMFKYILPKKCNVGKYQNKLHIPKHFALSILDK